MIKITFMGAGSMVFSKNVLGDTMLHPALCECEIALYDIDAVRLEHSYKLICLSTCEYTLENGRLVVAAVRIT